MRNETSIETRMPSLDELFSSQEERDDAKLKRIHEIPIEEIDPFPDHPYKVRDDEDMENLIESIRVRGVMTPAMVRQKEDGRYELISGHRRKRACELLGIPTLRCEIVDMSRDEAVVTMVESNYQRSTILPSEKAHAYKMRLDAMKRQGQRTDLTSPTPLEKLNTSAKKLASEVGESHETVRKYIRLNDLIPEILDMVDEGKIGLRPAVELSYIETRDNGWKLECNIVSWNKGAPKIDIRSWDPAHEKMSRGITLTETQAENLARLLADRYRERSARSRTSPAREDMER